MMTTITGIDAFDIRFPTSEGRHGSDAMHTDPDYSAAYVILRTDRTDGIEGHGLTFTIGRGTELCVAAVEALAHLVQGQTLASITADLAASAPTPASDTELGFPISAMALMTSMDS